SRPSADISFVVLGGADALVPMDRIQFDSPVSVQLTGLRAKVQGVGPGKALANDVTLAQAYYAAGDVESGCLQLGGIIALTKAQTGKKIPRLTATQLLSSATTVEGALGCQRY